MILKKLGNLYFDIIFRIVVHKTKNSIYFIDIDNTLADTWRSFLYYPSNSKERIKTLSIFVGMLNYVRKIMRSNRVVFLTSRGSRYYCITYNWLKNSGLPINILNVILVDSPHAKLKYLTDTVNKVDRIVLIDDMSYNQENCQIKFHNELVKKILSLPIEYIGYDDIQEINRVN